MKKIYLDNAATTPVLEEVIEVMSSSMRSIYGNPSSTHQFGRTAKSAIENARKNIAKELNVSASELIFTSGGSEADNLILRNAVVNLGVTQIVISKIEHHAVLNTVKELAIEFGITVSYVDINSYGEIDYVHLRDLLADKGQKTLVSLMYVNNEIGTILNVHKVATICKEYSTLFHSDAVQAVGHFDIDFKETQIDFVTAAAHKFHGPKGIGFAYFKKGHGVKPILFGGAQEKGARAGTEAVHLILGMEKALEISMKTLDSNMGSIREIKKSCISLLKAHIPGILFNGGSEDMVATTVTILNIRLPKDFPFMLFNLDMKGIAVSGGSACQSGSNKGSHVLEAILSSEESKKTSLRFSFSKHTTIEEIQYAVATLRDLVID